MPAKTPVRKSQALLASQSPKLFAKTLKPFSQNHHCTATTTMPALLPLQLDQFPPRNGVIDLLISHASTTSRILAIQ